MTDIRTASNHRSSEPSDARGAQPGRHRAWRIVSLGVLTLLLVLGTAAWWLWRSEAGTAWLLGRVPGLQVSGLSGRLSDGPLQADRLEWQSGETLVSVEGLSWQDSNWRLRPYPGAWVRIELVSPRVRRIEVRTVESGNDEPQLPPTDLRLPLEVVVRDGHIGVIEANAAPPLRDVSIDLHVGDDRGDVHRVSRLALTAQGLQASAQASVRTDGDMPVAANVELATLADAALAWRAAASLEGPLRKPSATAQLTTRVGARVDATATLTPFAAWPLAGLNATTHRLDLSTLADGLPRTSLSGDAKIDSTGVDAPVTANLRLENAAPTAWDEGGLPLRSANVSLQGRLDGSELSFEALQAQLADANEAAGRVSGSGRWQGNDLVVDLDLQGVRPSRLDRRVAEMTLSGPVGLKLNGIAVPGTEAPTPAQPAGVPAAQQAASAPLAGQIETTLTGRLAEPTPRDVRLAATASFRIPTDGSLDAAVERLQLDARPARATLTGRFERDVDQHYRLQSHGEFSRVDPSSWWTGGDARWRRGPHSLTGRWSTDLAAPAASFSAGARDLLAALDGTAELRLNDSRLAGLPLEGTATLVADKGDAVRIDSTLKLAGNRIAADVAAASAGDAGRLTATIDAPALASLRPIGKLVPGAEAWMPTNGTISGELTARGAWPDIATRGQLQARGVQGEGWRIGRADAKWNAGTAGEDAPLELDLDAGQLSQGEGRIERLQATLAGTLARHRLDLSASSPLRPPEWTDALTGNGEAPPRGGTLRLQGGGAWNSRADRGGSWQGRIERLLVAPPSPKATPWFSAQGLEGEVTMSADGGLRGAMLQPGSAQILGASLRWKSARYEARSAPGGMPLIEADAQLDPLSVAPLLAQLQPGFGWGGDLRVRGDINVTSGPRFNADIVLQRAGGDLTLTDDTGTRKLGLTDLRLGVAADGGTWHFTQALAGSNVGIVGGAQTVRTAADASWPPTDAPLEGVLELRVADLGAWGSWLPSGWRVGGQLRTSASFGGSLGEPRYSGEIVGSGMSVRNLLEGVHLRDGELAVALRGAEADIQRFVFKSGDGSLSVDGRATFEGTPQAQLRIAADDFLALDRLDRRIVVSGNADLRLREQNVAVKGRFTVDEGLIDVSEADAPQLDSDVIVVNRTGDEGARGSGTQARVEQRPVADRPADADDEIDAPDAGLLADADVSLHLDLGQELRLRGRGIKARLTGQLDVTTPEGELAVNGTVRIRSGTYQAYGQNLEIDRGIVTFTGDVAMPQLDILAVRPDIDTRVGVLVQGNAANPRISLFSEPEMTEMEKLSWLVMGRPSEGLGGSDLALLQSAALALLAGENSGESRSLAQRIGLDTLSVRQGDSGGVEDAVVSVGRQISKRLYLGYERGLNAAGGSWQLIYRIARQLNLRAQSGEESAVDLIRTWRWN